MIFACKRQYGFAPMLKEIDVISYNRKRIIFNVCGRQYIIKKYNDIPIVTLINFLPPYDF